MRIERLRIEGFGRLRGDVILDPERCNLVLAPNESGKSTLVAALTAALYGLPAERRSKNNPITARESFRPWGGGAYAVEVHLSLAGEGYRLRRDFDRDRVDLWEARTGKEVSDRFRGEGGRIELMERTVGLEREDFTRSALVMQEEIESIREAGDVTLRLQKFATSQAGDITAGEAVECLEESLRRYEGTQLAGHGKVETELGRLEERLVEVRRREAALQAETDGCGGDLELLSELGRRESELSAKLHRLDYLRTRAIIDEIDRQIREQEAATAELVTLQGEEAQVAPFAGFPLDSRAEVNELKGRARALSDHLQSERDDLRSEVEEPLAAVREDLRPHAAALALGPEEDERLETTAVRLRDLRDGLKESRRRLRRERRRLSREGLDPEELDSLRGRFGALAPEDRDFLAAYRERFLELEARHRERSEAPPQGSPGLPGGIRRGLAASGLLLLTGGVGAWLGLGMTLGGGAAAAVGLALLAAGLFFRAAAGPASATHRPGLEGQKESLRARADEIRGLLRYGDLDEALSGLRRLQELERRTGPLQEEEEACARVEEALGAAQEEASELLRRAGAEVPADRVRPHDVESLRDRVRHGRRLSERAEELEARARRGAAEVRALEERLADTHRRMAEILEAADLRPEAPEAISDRDLERFGEAADRARRLRQLREDLIPAAAARVAPQEWLARRRTERRTMEELLEEIQRRGPLDPPPRPEHSSNHYVLEFKRADDELRAVQRRRREAFGRVGDVLRRYREEGSKLAEERQRLQAAHRRASRFARGVRLAADLLRGISRESYEEWATALNDRANRTLAHLNPGYRDLRFDTDLSFTLEEVASGRGLDRDAVDAQLSSGARDQIYLAIRLAVSDYFSAGRYRLPLILDDALSAADDDRFDRALAYLAERVSPRHQVLLLSCHQARHERFRRAHEDLYDARILRVHLPAVEADSGAADAAAASPSPD